MLYLAEVQKQKGGLLGGGGKTELKLLACQRTDQSWNTVSEEIIATEEANKLNDGVLVLVEVNPNRQVQRIQEAGRPLVNILQNFSRQLEKFKVKEEEINQWKQSLTFQAQELNRREMDMETRLEQLQTMEEELQHLEEQRNEVETSRQENEQLQAEIKRNREELEGAWEHLRGEQRRLEESQTELQQGNILDQEKSQLLGELIEQLSSSVAPVETVRENLGFACELVERQQSTLNPHWQQLEQQKLAANEQQSEVNRLTQMFCELQNQWQQANTSLNQQVADMKANTATLHRKQEYAIFLQEQLKYYQDLYQRIQSFNTGSGNEVLHQNIDVSALEKMSLEELQKKVQDLQEKLHIDSSFVNEQEQELTHKQHIINELQQKIQQAPGEEQSQLESELAEEQDLYQMLNETLVGQRRSLLERQAFFKQHQAVLRQRQGTSLSNVQKDQTIDFQPLLLQVETQRQKQLEELQNLEHEIQQMQINIEQMQTTIDQQTQQQDAKYQELQALEQHLLSLRTSTAECWARVNLYQEALQPIQDCLDGLRHKLQTLTGALAKVQETGDYQLQAITQMRQTLSSFIC